MLQSLSLNCWQINNICDATPDVVPFKDRNDFVVCLTTVDHLNSANHARIQNNIGTIDESLRIDADIEWVTIGYGDTLAALGNFLSTVGLWNKSI